MSIKRYHNNRFLAWFSHKETACVLSLCFVVISSFFMAWSVILSKQQSAPSYEHSPISDPNFLGNLSQSILSNLSIYLIIVMRFQNPSEGLRYQSWYWFWLLTSLLSSVLGLSLYSAVPLASIVFLWIAAFAQVALPILFIVNTGPPEAERKEDIECHMD